MNKFSEYETLLVIFGGEIMTTVLLPLALSALGSGPKVIAVVTLAITVLALITYKHIQDIKEEENAG